MHLKCFGMMIMLVLSVLGDVEHLHEHEDESDINNLGQQQPDPELEQRQADFCKNQPEAVWAHLMRTRENDDSSIDANKNNKIELTEFKTALFAEIKKQNTEEFDELVERLDPQEQGVFSFKAYMSNMLEDTQDLDELDNGDPSKDDQEMADIRGFYKNEKARWMFISKEHGDYLDKEKLYTFLHWDETPEVKEFEDKLMFDSLDTNKDGKVTGQEFMRNMKATNMDDSVIDPTSKKFTSAIDLNGDGSLDLAEQQAWYTSNAESAFREEKEHVFDKCDANKDQALEPIEVNACCSAFVESQLTNFGADVLAPSSHDHLEEELEDEDLRDEL